MPEDIVTRLTRESFKLMDTEGVFLQAMQDIVKDEIKKRIMARIEKDPALREQIKIAVEDLIEARIKEGYAMMRLGKIAARIGLEMIPSDMKEDVTREFTSLLEREISEIFQKIS
ncbi:MAG: hypothetical protein KIY12_07155 [Thermoplasmata archaeon]|uniref:Uncharacterized protein n=1 Tax=Candidatus Sysuiplasma superficiale TaxID=2823368 RepID=A0A8J8CCD7_9ARCH|nr:hypothetical protein [Candidatus Sysuiplasma superficiale]MBX8644481.1 hypothetical protein [Candidatus Sysuiplasma superficiale]MCL4346907.1 hypothetical protein [Candidatus Thermoplasmatota archaeon]